jgi:hypothetical protein
MTKLRSIMLVAHNMVVFMGKMRNSYRNIIGKPEIRRPFGKHLHSWENNIEMCFREIG